MSPLLVGYPADTKTTITTFWEEFTMSNIYTSADQLIGKTPLLELTHIEKEEGLEAKVLAKL